MVVVEGVIHGDGVSLGKISVGAISSRFTSVIICSGYNWKLLTCSGLCFITKGLNRVIVWTNCYLISYGSRSVSITQNVSLIGAVARE